MPPRAANDGGAWTVWLFLGGRGAGKTWAGARFVRGLVTGAKPRANFRAMGFTADSNCASRFAYGRITPHH